MDPFMSRIHDGIIEGMTGDLGTEIKKSIHITALSMWLKEIRFIVQGRIDIKYLLAFHSSYILCASVFLCV